MSDKKDAGRFGKEFENAINRGLENNDWSGLNDVIVRSVDNFLDGVGDRMNSAMGASRGTPLSQRNEDFSGSTRTAEAQRRLHAERQRQRENLEKQRREREEARRAKQVSKRKLPAQLAYPYKSISGGSTALTVVGGIGTGVTAVGALSSILPAMLTGGFSAGAVVTTAVFLAGFGWMLALGLRRGGISDSAKRYVEVIGSRTYIDIKTLALLLNKTERKVVREIKKFLALGLFPQGHLDRNNTVFILTDEVFNHYLELETRGSDNIIDTTGRYEDEQEFPTLSPEDSAELSGMIKEGNEYMARIHSLNDDIPGVEISAKLDRLEGLLREIFMSIKEHPEQMSKIHELMDYYLPTAVKLVDAYREYDRVSEPGREILSAKNDIENTLDTINSALGKLLNRLFKDSVLDVTTDAQVLKTVLAQKGLSTGMEENLKGDKQ
ncbi:MAG: 5-bromo-4-chloroindolyl phosphate hydrolysis family protein [Lachnospiraceae bacterium]|nr:5-bromo-4-chloroindolyl phosphate hydrolysis family protein [Lachnospiraceae bacterium]